MLIEKIHEMYLKDKVTKDIFKAIEKYLHEIKESIDEVERQRLLNFTSWYMPMFEEELGISEKEAEYDKRCEVIRAKLATRGNVSVEKARQMCLIYAEAARIIYDAEKKTLQAAISEDITPEDLEKVMKNLREYIPAHILIGHEVYKRTHGEIKEARLTHADLHKYTHEQIQRKGRL